MVLARLRPDPDRHPERGFRVGGDLKCKVLLNLDHDVQVHGKAVGRVLSERADDLREALVPEVFDLESDPDATSPDGGLLRKRLAAGLPILKQP